MNEAPDEPPDRHRVFFALWPDDATRAAISRATREAVRTSGGRPIAKERLHVTIAFLGELTAAGLEVARDAKGRCPRGFGLVGMPSAYLIDAAGRVRAVTRGFRPGEARALRGRIEALLAEAPESLPAVAAGRSASGEADAPGRIPPR